MAQFDLFIANLPTVSTFFKNDSLSSLFFVSVGIKYEKIHDFKINITMYNIIEICIQADIAIVSENLMHHTKGKYGLCVLL